MNPILVTSTAAGTGKTAIAIALALEARERGLTIGYMKPKGTRLRSAVGKIRDDDPLLAADLLDLDADLEALEPVVYSPTFVTEAIRGRESPAAIRDRVRDAYDDLADGVDLMVVEGGGDVWTGGIIELTDPDVAALLDARSVLVSSYTQPHDLDPSLAAARALDDHLEGLVFNEVADGHAEALAADVVPFLEGRSMPVLGDLPRDPKLAGVPIADLAEGLGAETLVDPGTEDRIERFGVGAMGSESALAYFRRLRNAAVVIGGDRPDVQAAALQAPGVHCLVLTGGYRPPDTVLGLAQDRGVPVLLVNSDARTTIERMEGVLETGRTRTTAAVDRMRELLREGVDIDRLLSPDAS